MDKLVFEKILDYQRQAQTLPCPKGLKHLFDYDADFPDERYDEVKDNYQCEFCLVWFCPCHDEVLFRNELYFCISCDSIFCPDHTIRNICLKCIRKELEVKSKKYKGKNVGESVEQFDEDD